MDNPHTCILEVFAAASEDFIFSLVTGQKRKPKIPNVRCQDIITKVTIPNAKTPNAIIPNVT